ncbi:MAG: type I-B CRISPR-associated endonuclease Cas1b [Fervidobacterium sp.]
MKKDYFVFTSGKLKRKDNTLFFESEGGEKRSIPIETVDSVHVFGELEINSKLLNFLAQNEVSLHVYNYYGFYSGSFVPRKSNVSGFLTIKQAEHYLNKDRRLFLAKCFVEAAAYHMLRNVRNYKVQESTEKIEKMFDSFQETEFLDIGEIMSAEAGIRKEYYKSFTTITRGRFDFQKRTKHPPEDPINTLISFTNSLVYTTTLSEIYKTILDPTISFLHEPSTQRFSLCLDISEIFKPLIGDPVIFSMINLKQLSEDDFEWTEEFCFLNDTGKKKVLKEYQSKLETTIIHRKLKRKVSYKKLITLECYKLVKHFLGDEIYKPLKAWW